MRYWVQLVFLNYALKSRPNNYNFGLIIDRVKSGIFGQTAKFGQPLCLFHSSIIGIKIN